MSHIFIIHGFKGTPQGNWFPWLKGELKKLGHQVFVPQFPTPENQTLSNWLKTLEQYREFIDQESIFIGHSLGVPFILNVLERYPVKVAVLVAGFIGKTENSFDDGMKTFAQKSFAWTKIKNNCSNFLVFNSDNDPYLKPEKGKELATSLGTKAILIKKAGHINRISGFLTFDLLLQKLKPLL